MHLRLSLEKTDSSPTSSLGMVAMESIFVFVLLIFNTNHGKHSVIPSDLGVHFFHFATTQPLTESKPF